MVNNQNLIKKSKGIIFRCDASSSVGYGHFSRCLSIAKPLKELYSWDVSFAMLNSTNASERLKDMGYEVFNKQMDEYSYIDEDKWFQKLVLTLNLKAVIMDFRTDLSIDTLNKIKKDNILIVTLDDPSTRRLHSDIAFYPPVPQVKEMSWEKFNGTLYCGWEWVPLKKSIYLQRKKNITKKNTIIPSVFLTMGGSDPAGITLKVLRSIDSLKKEFKCTILLGPEFIHLNDLNKFLAKSKRKYDVQDGGYDLSDKISKADIAIISFGVTAYEMSALGIPSIIISLTDDHARSASIFKKMGMSISLGNFKNLKSKKITDALSDLLDNRSKLDEMRSINFQTIDGLGSERIAKIIHEAI